MTAFAQRNDGGMDVQRLGRVLDHIDANLERHVSLDELAAIACLSRFHFARVFKASTGRTPGQYMAALRVERAKQLLMRGNDPLLDIAMALNFSSQATFTRAFRIATGKTPAVFARQSTLIPPAARAPTRG